MTFVRSFISAGLVLMTAAPASAQSGDGRVQGDPAYRAALQQAPQSAPAGPAAQPAQPAAATQPASSTPPASSTQAAPAAQPVPAPLPVAGFQDGFFIQTANGDNRLLFGLVSQLDGRFSINDSLVITNTFAIRKVRPTFSGRVARYFDFKIMPDFGNGTTTITDASLDIRFSPKLRVRAGKDKTPVGYELLIGDAFLLFPERSLASSLVPNRDVGVGVLGELSPKFSYSAVVVNGVPDGSSSTTDVDTNDGKDLAGRIVVQPFRQTGTAATGPLNGLGFHLGGSYGKQIGALPSFRTSVGQTYFNYAVTALADGTRTRVSPAVFYYHKGFGGFAEFMRNSQRVTRAGVSDDVVNHGWDVTGAYLLTGEVASDRGVRPRSPFDPTKGQWGAVQVLARYTALTVDRAAFTGGLAAPGASRVARSWTLGVNWYPNPWIKWYATVERTTFEGETAVLRPDENVVFLRFQLGF